MGRLAKKIDHFVEKDELPPSPAIESTESLIIV